MTAELAPLLEAFHSAVGSGAAVWTRSRASAPPVLLAAAPCPPGVPDAAELPWVDTPRLLRVDAGTMLVTRTAGPRPAWVGVGPLDGRAPAEATPLLALLSAAVAQQLVSIAEVEQAAAELAERYEEINLLYTISEILGRTVEFTEAAPVILTEVSETVGARCGAILVHDPVTDTLYAAAVLGATPVDVPPIAIDDGESVSAHVFRSKLPRLVEPGDGACEAESAYREGVMLSVPILWTEKTGGVALGVINLSGRPPRQHFSAGDQKLVTAIATQIGTAIENARLVRTSLRQQRFAQEMQHAHDLQMALLPKATVVEPDALVATRVVPAESVGGDFYHLFPLGRGRSGVMIGDVSGHGYHAALIVALTMSAAGIHAQSTSEPGAMLGRLLGSVGDELQRTEMFITAFYGVIDRDAGELYYANAGHPHAFVVGADGSVERLLALDPPLGMIDDPPHGRRRPWAAGRDTLVLFTDGISDARDRHGRVLGEQAVLDAVTTYLDRTPDEIVQRVFDVLNLHAGDVPRRDDLTLIVARS